MMDRTSGRIQALYVTGTLAGLDDAELLARFVVGGGIEREDAFAALVRRHGAMVLSVCLRMLGGDRAGADDAFQAVFLVLARKAGSLRRPDRLRPWLYGVAVKAGKEARRRSVRIHAREGGSLVDGPAPQADADLFELRAAIDEELERLPGRYREPILLCELEGASRRDAAQRLGLAEGTLSSRLARGKALLRDRLARRGLAVGALAAALAPVKAAGLDPLAAAAVRFALSSPPPVAAAAVAEGVLAMLSAAKIKALATVSVAALGLIAATAGIARGLSQDAPAPKAAARVDKPEPAPRDEGVGQRFRGVVVDEAGRPLAGADVLLRPFSPREVVVKTGADGSYALSAPRALLGRATILARSADGLLIGYRDYDNMFPGAAEAAEPARIVARPPREVRVRVVDSADEPVAGATVEAAGGLVPLASATTGVDGEIRLAVPADVRVQWIIARKSAVGCDFAEFGEIDALGNGAGVKAEELPGSVALKLAEPRTVRIRALDEDGAPVAGVPIRLWMIGKDGRRSDVNYGSRLQVETTGPDGVAVFDWLPAESKDKPIYMDRLIFWPDGEEYARRRAEVGPGRNEAELRLDRNVAIRGRATLSDGSPAKGLKVAAEGTGRGLDGGHGGAITADDGGYEMLVPPDEAYAVYVEDPDWAAPARMDVIARRGRPVVGVDFHLTKGTVLKGKATMGPDDRPAIGDYVGIGQKGAEPPDDLRSPARPNRRIGWSRLVDVDDQGRYSTRLAPGKYTLSLSAPPPARRSRTEIEITGQPEMVHDFHRDMLTRGPVVGRVVDPAGAPVANARVEFPRGDEYGAPLRLTTDADGRFAAKRWLMKTFVFARGPAGNLAALVEIGPDDADLTLTLAPTAAASGRILDDRGEPARRREVVWGAALPRADEAGEPDYYYDEFSPDVLTDDDGRFTMPTLLVGWKYEISARGDDDGRPGVGFVRPERPGPFDAGTLRIKPEGRE